MSAKRMRIASSSSSSDGNNNSFMFNQVLPLVLTTDFWCNPSMVPMNAIYAMPMPVAPMMFWPCMAPTSGGAPVKMKSSQPQLGSFLERCHLCKKWIGDNDVYMYGNLQAFCSSECRDKQILIDKSGETRSNCKVARRLL
nr:protein mard1 [Quercus suber]